jgi:beta-galactosidase
MPRPSSALLSIAALAAPVVAQTTVRLDATAQGPAPRSDHLRLGTSNGPAGTITANSRWLSRDGKPFLPVMGEFHFSRYPAAEWEEELLKMKAAGVTVVASYVIWNQHELAPGTLDWSGDRDVRHFVELCRKHGLLFFVRPGPWAHAETRFGGIPDWVVASTRVRSNDPAYLVQVERFWRALYDQLRGQLWKDGGPVIGMQLENEYNATGPGQGRGHIATLKALARQIGFDVPLYTVTGWDQTVYPRGEVLPVMGGYPDEPWAASRTMLPPKENYLFRFTTRVSGDLGAQTRGGKRGDAEDDVADTPFLGAEYGGGVPSMYRRRPLIEPADIAATVTTQLGSGVNLLGYYMFHGGANPLAAGRGLEETARSGGYNDVPTIGYDFQAPLGQYGEVGTTSAAIRPLHYFLNAYGATLAMMAVHRPAVVPRDQRDLATLRWSVRSAGDSGFVFVNNHVRQYPMAEQRDVRFAVTFPGGTVTFPTRGLTIPAGASFVWPVGLDLDGVILAWATAQPVTRLEDDSGPIHVLAASLDGSVELAFGADVARLSVPAARDAAGRWIAQVTPGPERIVTATRSDGRTVRFLLLDRASAGRLWVGEAFGKRRLVITDADLFFTSDGITLRQRGERAFAGVIWPRVDTLVGSSRLTRRGARFGATVSGAAVRPIAAQPMRPAGDVPPIEIGGLARAAMQPLPETHRAAATWQFTIPSDAATATRNAVLEIDYRGDIARLFDGTTMLDDAYWDGRRWRIGLRRFAQRLGKPWQLTLLPLRADAPIYLDQSARQSLPATGQIATLAGLRLLPEHELVLRDR